jgi:hypothetical protein
MISIFSRAGDRMGWQGRDSEIPKKLSVAGYNCFASALTPTERLSVDAE